MILRERIFEYILKHYHDLSMQFITFATRSLTIKDLAKIQLELRKQWRNQK